MKYILFFLVFFNIGKIFAQNIPQNKRPLMPNDTAFVGDTTHILEKKSYWGFSFNSSWTSLGFKNQPEGYFFKPSLGGGLVYQYYFTKKRNIGFETGLTYQQRGAGISYNDQNSTDIDSSTRWRFRLATVEIPLKIIYRSNFLMHRKSTKFTLSAGILPSYTFLARRIYISAEDGLHTFINEDNNFQKLNFLAHVSAGVDIAAGEDCVLQLQLQGQLSINNAYKSSGNYGSFSGNNSLVGLRLGFLF